MQDIGIAEAFLAKIGLYLCWRKDGERLREITRVCESLRELGGLSEAGFSGFPGVFRMAEPLLVKLRSHESWTRDHERLQAFASVGLTV